jgi:hypothetical protein
VSTTFTAQTIAFIVPTGTVPEAFILTDTGIIAAQNASVGNDMLVNYQQYYNATSGNQWAYTLTFFVTAAFALNIIAGIAALKTRIQALAPNVTDVVTWGHVIAFN